MPFWRKETEEEKRQKEFQEASQKALTRGELPLVARQRLELQRQSGARFFSSDLTANEYLLTREAGYEPIGQVMGSCFYKVGFRGFYAGFLSQTGELLPLSQAHLSARERAVSRLAQEAAILGAHGVIGVRLKLGGYDWSAGTTEFTAVGTAVRIADRPAPERPFTSDLSGQEFWQLYEAGYWPLGLVMGCCSYYVHGDYSTRATIGGLFTNWQNQEMVQFTQGFQNARSLAVRRLTEDTEQHGAEGAVGMKIEYELEDIEYERMNITYYDLLVNFTAIGTAIKHDKSRPTAMRTRPVLMQNLRYRTLRQIEFEEPIEDLVDQSIEDLLDDADDE